MNRIWFFVLLLLTSIGLFTSSAYAVALQSENNSGNKLAEQTTGLLAGGSGSIDLPSVDAEKIREAWLNWHNEERTSKWLEKLNYQSDLKEQQLIDQRVLSRNTQGIKGQEWTVIIIITVSKNGLVKEV